MSKENEGCILLAKAKALAIKKGLNAELIVCEEVNLCDGVHCIYIRPKVLDEPKSKTEQGHTWD